MNKSLWLLLIVVRLCCANGPEIPEAMRSCFEGWTAEHGALLAALHDRGMSFEAKMAQLEAAGFTNLSRYNYIFVTPCGMVRIPSERTRFVNFICAKGLEAALNEGRLKPEDIAQLRTEFLTSEAETYQGISQRWTYEKMADAQAQEVFDTSVVHVPGTYLYPYPGKSSTTQPHDDTHFVVQEPVDHKPVSLAELVLSDARKEREEFIKAAWAGQLWNHEGNIGRGKDGRLVLTDLEKPDRLLPTDDPSRSNIFALNGVINLMQVAQGDSSLREFLAACFTPDRFTSGEFDPETYFRQHILGQQP